MEERQLRGKIEEQLVKKAFEGDVSAFNELYMYLRVPIYNFAYRMLNISTAAEDITQETFIFLIEHPDKYQAKRGSLKTFLCGVARNRILHYFRKRERTSEVLWDEKYHSGEVIDSSGDDPLGNLLDLELMGKVKESLLTLSPLLREVIILREIQEYSYKEISEITGDNINTIKVRLHRARGVLAIPLAQYLSKGRRMSCNVIMQKN